MKKVRLEFQFFHGCPNHGLMARNIRQATVDLSEVVDLIEVAVEDDATAQRVQFRGSPTLLIDGEDIGGMPAPGEFSVSCRYYPNGIPSAVEIRQRILERVR